MEKERERGGNVIKKMKRGCNGGFTIVELIVAAVVLIVVIISLVGVMRYARHEQTVDYHRRQARALINRTFENAFPSNSKLKDKYPLYQHIIMWVDEDGEGGAEGKEEEREVLHEMSVSATKTSDTHTFERILIDRRTDFAQVEADMNIVIEYQPFTVGVAPNNSTIDTHLITITVRWPEVGQSKTNKAEWESITLTKRLASVGL